MEIASLIISVFSILFVTATFFWEWKIHNTENLKYCILTYVFEFYQPIYIIDKLPTTKDILEHFNKRNKQNKNEKIKYLLMQLNHQELIIIVTDQDRSFENVCWKPNTKHT